MAGRAGASRVGQGRCPRAARTRPTITTMAASDAAVPATSRHASGGPSVTRYDLPPQVAQRKWDPVQQRMWYGAWQVQTRWRGSSIRSLQ